jgi:hypothetical protein
MIEKLQKPIRFDKDVDVLVVARDGEKFLRLRYGREPGSTPGGHEDPPVAGVVDDRKLPDPEVCPGSARTKRKILRSMIESGDITSPDDPPPHRSERLMARKRARP